MQDLYDSDFLLWTEQQAHLLRSQRYDELDLKNLIEEIEDLGKSELRTCRSYVKLIMLHLLYLRYWDTELERNKFHWEGEVTNWRVILSERLTGSFKNKVLEEWDNLYQTAAREFEKKTGLCAPDVCPFSQEDILE